MSKQVKNNTGGTRERQLICELKQLRRELCDTREGAMELSRAVDGVVAAIVRQCGTRTESGYMLSLPAVRLGESGSVSTKHEGDHYVITVTDTPDDNTPNDAAPNDAAADGKDTPEIG